MRTLMALLASVVVVLAGCTTAHPRSAAPVSSTGLPAASPGPEESPPGAVLTRGRGDVDGDGRADLVTVRTEDQSQPNVSVVTVRFATGRVVSTTVTMPSLRYQGIADVSHDGQGDIFVWVSAAGCCRPYPSAYGSYVLRWFGGRLRLLSENAKPFAGFAENSGRGDVFYGWSCTGPHPVIRSVDYPAHGFGTVRTSTVYISGWQVHTRTSGVKQRITPAQAFRFGRVACPPLNQVGFDPRDTNVFGD